MVYLLVPLHYNPCVFLAFYINLLSVDFVLLVILLFKSLVRVIVEFCFYLTV